MTSPKIIEKKKHYSLKQKKTKNTSLFNYTLQNNCMHIHKPNSKTQYNESKPSQNKISYI